jgi:hypothetical protein
MGGAINTSLTCPVEQVEQGKFHCNCNSHYSVRDVFIEGLAKINTYKMYGKLPVNTSKHPSFIAYIYYYILILE